MMLWALWGGALVMAVMGTQDARLTQVRHLNLRYPLPNYPSAEEWQRRREVLRLQVQIACGLFPPLPKTPLNPRRIVCHEDDEVVVERWHWKSSPAFS